MTVKNTEKNKSSTDQEKTIQDRIEKQSPDLTELVFDLFFDKEFKGNIDPTEDMKNKKKSSN